MILLMLEEKLQVETCSGEACSVDEVAASLSSIAAAHLSPIMELCQIWSFFLKKHKNFALKMKVYEFFRSKG